MNSWQLPEGINESLPDEAEKLESLRRQLIDLYAVWGYRLVMPPLAEYMESLRAGMGTLLDLQTFKITDQSNGRLMGVRADMTPQVARIDAHRMAKGNLHAAPNRLCYIGTVLRTRSVQQGGSRSPTQVGAELFGHAGIESDFEIISLMLQTLKCVDVNDLVLDIGHVAIANGLCDRVQMTADQREHYFDMLSRRSIPEIDAWIDTQGFSEADSSMLRELANLNGSPAIIKKTYNCLRNAGGPVLNALNHLKVLVDLLSIRYPALQINIDLAELRGYAYHTGIVYAAYVPGRGSSIARGGRYDGIGKAFSNARPATGFSTDLCTLSEFVTTRKSSYQNAILAPFVLDESLDHLIMALRDKGECVIRQLDSKQHNTAKNTAENSRYNRKIVTQDDNWVVVPI